MRNTRNLPTTLALLVLGLTFSAPALAKEDRGSKDRDDLRGRRAVFFGGIDGFQEVPSSIFTPARGAIAVGVDPRSRRFKFELDLSRFPEGDRILQAHLHFSRAGSNGGVVAFLCASEPRPVPSPPGVERCPAGGGGRVSGVLEETDLIGLPAQGFPAGDFDALLGALRRGAIYVNVHTTDHPSGEIRGQLR